MNIDHDEIQKFSAIATRWWDKSGEFKPLHDINPLRVAFIAEQANGLFGKNIVDVGCGGGILSEAMAAMGANVTGIDMSSEALEVAKLHGLESQIDVTYHTSTAEAYAEQHADTFDIVTCLEMLEHVPEPASVVQACARLVKPGGLVFFSTLNRNVKSYLMAIVGAEYLLNLVPKGTHSYAKFIQPSELLNMVDSTSLVPLRSTGLHLSPLTQQYYLSNKNIDVNYLVVCQKQDFA
ncbi:bifunctional 2-polyprenyl-6-hydroxyphenol methylase/3-demethylubiquinol 3-O-methyltransferase UbiG [Alteromonas oceanisediminis]|uniref:bifunctional 2-polyprenyl-6-hydroxyphenol methylase/3-demethylubiquinol 3-O-methyltransferase UbiG n=1 Tax=Alteromonas oceanisediminis TaxID=2836180 RepID=UPI001BDAC406|nr:bifunctional 2-polyprenyl-6-hydroxyphenol methylase/3-demethylubiquinol 3-O-methyltransferase UbiG [Alteromonas oceanisediminis]MBT0586358.1 bifunctional 2-polyprenyl-6-hydroxyphenol methylase/3-demethylubiquinol 3-O-methyltransferase UbiG [Alteromonas oceanisediminis]